MNKQLWLLLLLAGCHPNTAEQRAPINQPTPAAKQPAASAKPAVHFTSGDQPSSGPRDTLHVGQGLVLRLLPGSASDFAKAVPIQTPFSEARTIRRHGNGRVRRVGHALVVRPFHGPTLRFADDNYQIRKDENEEKDTRCTFSGGVPGRPYWLVDSLQWERYQPFLINKQSGRTTLLSNSPEISPSRQFLFVATPGLDGESSLNGLELLAISDQEVKLLWTRTLRSWQPQRARWLDNHTVAIEQMRFEPKERATYVRLILP